MRPARIRLRSLRWRVSLLLGAVAVLVAAGIGGLVHQVTKARFLESARDTAVERVRFVARGGSQTSLAKAYTLPPEKVSRALRSEGPGDRRKVEEVQGPYGPEMRAAEAVDGGRLLMISIPLSGQYDDLHRLDMTMAAAGAAAVAVAVPAGALVASRMSLRLRRAARAARRIADGELDARIGGEARPGDEVAELSSAVDSMASALQTRLLEEQRFTADVAHELRTPLMGLSTSAALLTDDDVAAQYVRESVKVLSGLVEGLLEVSRLDAGVEEADLVPCPLGPLIAECVSRTGLAVELRGHEARGGGCTVHTDPRRVDRVLGNLVANAHRHGAGPVVVTVGSATVTVRDHGPGFPQDLLDEGPRRFRTGAAERGRGHGLGLTIATAHARLAGGELTFVNAPDGGAVATLTLPLETTSFPDQVN